MVRRACCFLCQLVDLGFPEFVIDENSPLERVDDGFESSARDLNLVVPWRDYLAGFIEELFWSPRKPVLDVVLEAPDVSPFLLNGFEDSAALVETRSTYSHIVLEDSRAEVELGPGEDLHNFRFLPVRDSGVLVEAEMSRRMPNPPPSYCTNRECVGRGPRPGLVVEWRSTRHAVNVLCHNTRDGLTEFLWVLALKFCRPLPIHCAGTHKAPKLVFVGAIALDTLHLEV